MQEYEKQIAQLQRNADALIQRSKAGLHAEFVSIDKANALRSKGSATRSTKLAPPTIHDLASNNPILRKLLRDMQGR